MFTNKKKYISLKLENILILNPMTFDLVIADFGLSAFNFDKNMLYKRCGTPGYVAPEIIS